MRDRWGAVGLLGVLWLSATASPCGGDSGSVQPQDTQTGDVADTSDAVDTTDTIVPPPLDMSAALSEGQVRAGVAVKASDLIGGPKAEGILGDIKLYNAHVGFVIEGARDAGGYRYRGGHVVDLDTTRPPGEPGRDRFGEVFFAWNLEVFEPRTVEIVDDGRDGGVARVRFEGGVVRHPWPDSFLRKLLNPPGTGELNVVYEYALGPDDRALGLTVTLTNAGDEVVDMRLPVIVSNQGDGIVPFSPGRGVGELISRNDLPYVAAIGMDHSYGLYVDAAPLSGLFTYQAFDLVLVPEFEVAPGASHELKFAYTTGDNGVTSVVSGAPAWRTPATPNGTLEGEVLGASDWPHSWVVATQEPDVISIVPVRAGRYEMQLPPGSYALEAWTDGVGRGVIADVTVQPDGTDEIDLGAVPPALVDVDAVDQNGTALPARYTFRRRAGETPFAPGNRRLGGSWSGDISAVHFGLPEAETVALPPGEYDVVASRGYSYELDSKRVTLTAGVNPPLTFELQRVVDTSGWLAADTHLHGMWSSDSSVSEHTRARQAAADDVSLPILTEHAYIGDLRPAARELSLDGWVTSIPAQEVTTFEYGHFCAYPLERDVSLPSFGAVFEHGLEGTELFDEIQAQQDDHTFIQVAHPHSSNFGGYFAITEYDAQTDVAGAPERWSHDWDVLQVFNGDCGAASDVRTRDDWYALNNHGYRKIMTAGSDSHSVAKPIGHPRSWIPLDRATLDGDPQEIVAPLQGRNTFVSCGPFVRFSAADGTVMGGMTSTTDDGSVAFDVVVEAPTWIGVDAVNLIANGVVVDSRDLTVAAPDGRRPALRFAGQLSHTPDKDSWYVVEVTGTGDLAPIKGGDAPYALTNPIEVDVDGDDVWTAPGVAVDL